MSTKINCSNRNEQKKIDADVRHAENILFKFDVCVATTPRGEQLIVLLCNVILFIDLSQYHLAVEQFEAQKRHGHAHEHDLQIASYESLCDAL